MKSNETKMKEAFARSEYRGNDLEQLKRLNNGNYYAKKERTKIAKRNSIPFSETFNII